MEGDDHVEAYERLPEAVAAMHKVSPNLDAKIASLEDFLAVVPSPRTSFAGELVGGRYRPILRGVNSTRVWIKQENARCERLLLERCEPLDAITGGDERDELRSLWRTLLQNHPHDSICGCSIDDVHDIDMRPRFDRVSVDGATLAASLERRVLGEGNTTLVWNDLPWARDAVVDLDGTPTRVRCAAFGAVAASRIDGAAVRVDGDGAIENELLRVEVATDGWFVVVDKQSGGRSGTQNLLVDDGDRGDEYTYSYAGPTVGSRGIAGTRSPSARALRDRYALADAHRRQHLRLARSHEPGFRQARLGGAADCGTLRARSRRAGRRGHDRTRRHSRVRGPARRAHDRGHPAACD